MLKGGATMILLDEPTTISTSTRYAASRTGILDFPGCVAVISHDRWFLDRIATTSSPSRATAGGLVRGQLRRLRSRPEASVGSEADQPHRLKYSR